jgi:hypothetical protein
MGPIASTPVQAAALPKLSTTRALLKLAVLAFAGTCIIALITAWAKFGRVDVLSPRAVALGIRAAIGLLPLPLIGLVLDAVVPFRRFWWAHALAGAAIGPLLLILFLVPRVVPLLHAPMAQVFLGLGVLPFGIAAAVCSALAMLGHFVGRRDDQQT